MQSNPQNNVACTFINVPRTIVFKVFNMSFAISTAAAAAAATTEHFSTREYKYLMMNESWKKKKTNEKHTGTNIVQFLDEALLLYNRT